MNVLLTSVGRRAYMVKYFKELLGNSGEVHVSNSDERNVSFLYADKHTVTPLIYDDNYIPFLLDYCKTNKIDLLLSLFDIDLLILAKNKEKFAAVGTTVIVSDPEIVEICNDKWKTFTYLKQNGFHVPATFLEIAEVEKALKENMIQFPLIVKPRFGCGSISIAVAEDQEELAFWYRKVAKDVEKNYLKYESAAAENKVIIQQCLQGQEYGADIIHDLQGNPCNIIIRKKIAMRSGETDIAELTDQPDIRNELEKLSHITGHIANMDCDIFLVDGTPYLLEMNARFGGGYPFSHMGGCNLPKAILTWAKGEQAPEDCLSVNYGVCGFKEIIITTQDGKNVRTSSSGMQVF